MKTKKKLFTKSVPVKSTLTTAKKVQQSAQREHAFKKYLNKLFTYNKVVHRWLHKHDSDIQLILFPLILLIILIILSVFNNQLLLTIDKQEPVSNDEITFLHPYPYVQAADT